jgi:hypothetical protein
MTCRDIENNLIGYIENTLPLTLKQEMDLHIQECKECRLMIFQVIKTYNVLDTAYFEIPDLYPGIKSKLKRHHTTVVEFVPQHKIIFRVAASLVVLIGIAMGVILGGKYSSTRITGTTANSAQYDLPEYYTSESNSMDNESDLAVLYANE